MTTVAFRAGRWERRKGPDMRLREMTVTTCLAVGVVVVLIAFTAGVLSATFGWDGVMAQEAERTDPEINTEPSAPPLTPFPSEVLKLYPVTTIIEHEAVPPAGLSGQSSSGSAGTIPPPESGKYLHLPSIGRYYSLPDDVVLEKTIMFGYCGYQPGVRCSQYPLYIFRRGDARVAIDSVGDVFEDVENGDASAFPFFTGESSDDGEH